MKKTITTLALVLLLAGNLLHAQQFMNFTTANGLPSDNVMGVAVDTNNTKWFATQDGVARYNGTAWTTYTTANGLIDNYINCIAVDKSGHIWAGTDLGISRFDGTAWTSFTTANGLPDNTINYMAGDTDGSIWIGTGNGLSHYNGTVWTNYTTANGLPANMISYIAVTGTGVKWIGTFLGGLSKYDGSAFTNFTTADSLPDNNIISIAFGENDTRWIGTYLGVAVFDAQDNWVKTYRQGDGLLSNFVQDITMDSQKTMWFGQYDLYTQDGGISRLRNNFWSSYTTGNGLIAAQVKRIAIDQQDDLWVATGAGVTRIYDIYLSSGDIEAGRLSICPNPAFGEVRLSGITSPGKFSLMTIEGKILLSQEISAGTATISLDGIPAGLYLVRYADSTSIKTGKLIIR